MSALTDFFSSLAGKIRSKLGTSRTYTPAEAVAAIDDVYNKGVTDTKKGNAERSHVLSPKTFTSLSAGVNQTGSMPDKSGWKSTGHNLNSTTVQQVSIPAGYHNGSGYVEFNSLSSQTGIDSGKSAIDSNAVKAGYQGWVNGQKITGTLSLSGDAASNHVLYGKTFYNNTWTKQSGQMPNRGTIPTKYLNGGETYTIPDGYHSGSGKVIANTVGDQTKVDPGKTAIDPGAVKAGYQGWVNGQKITGTLSLSGNAPNAYVLSGYTFYNNTWTKQTGSMRHLSSDSRYQHASNNGTKTLMADACFMSNVYDQVSKTNIGNYVSFRYAGSKDKSNNTMYDGYITTNTLFALPYSTLASALGVNASYMLNGYSILGINGNIPQRSSSSQVPENKAWHWNNRIYFGVEYGYYPAASYGNMSNVSEKYITYDALARDIGANGDSIRPGHTILGISGTPQSATFTPTNSQYNLAQADMGENNSYRYVNTAVCYKAGNDYGTWIMDNRWLGRRARYQGRITRDNQQWGDTFDGIVIVFCGNSTNISIDWNYSGGISGESRISGATQWGWSFLSFRASGNFWFMVRNGEGEVFYIQ